MRRMGMLLGLALGMWAGSAGAETAPEIRVLGFAEKGANLVMRGTFTDVFDANLLQRLSGDVGTVIVVRVGVFVAGSDVPLWLTPATYSVSYYPWDETYYVELRDPAGQRELRFASRAEALKAVTTFDDFPIAPLFAIAVSKHYYAGVVVEVNPLSAEVLAEVRRWLARPRGGQVGGDASFFGSFVSVFVNPKNAPADRTLRFRTQEFYRVPR